MIRERRAQDIAPLSAICEAIEFPEPGMSQQQLAGWLEDEPSGTLCWVFDQAPLRTAPTRNVIGHVQMRPLPKELVVLEKFFVKPVRHEADYARQLLKESVNFILSSGKVPMLDQSENRFPSRDFCERLGFVVVPTSAAGQTTMVFSREAREGLDDAR